MVSSTEFKLLMNGFYRFSVDIWSVGCIFARNIFPMIKENFADFTERHQAVTDFTFNEMNLIPFKLRTEAKFYKRN